MRRNCFILSLLAMCAIVGCSGQKAGVNVSGTVTHDGKPLPRGRIYFNPDFSKENDGPQGFAPIVDGTYDTRQQGRRAHGGASIAVITGGDSFTEWRTPVDLP